MKRERTVLAGACFWGMQDLSRMNRAGLAKRWSEFRAMGGFLAQFRGHGLSPAIA